MPHTISFPFPVTMKEGFAVGWARGNEVLVAPFGYGLKSGHWKVDARIHRLAWHPSGRGWAGGMPLWRHVDAATSESPWVGCN